jgi:Tol biopolymer transport system component
MAAHQPHWAPSGDRLAFMGKAAGERARWRIYLARAEGGALEEALPEGDDQGVPSWSADGQSIIFGDRKTQVGFNGATIHQLNLATHTVSGIDSPVGLWSPRMSPDGRHLAAVTHDNKSLYVRDNGRKTWRRCLTMEALDDAVWSRDSSWIQFVGVGSAKTSTLFRVPVGCGEAKEVLDLSAYQFVGDTWFGIAPDGSPMGLVRLPDEIYAIEWRLALRLP